MGLYKEIIDYKKEGFKMVLIKRKYWSVIAFIVLPLCLFGCSTASNKADAASNVTEGISLNSGAMLKSEEGKYNLYNYDDGQYSKMDIDKIILTYDKESSNYIGINDSGEYFVSKGNKYDIKDNDIRGLKLSKEGKYISYFIQDNGLKLKIYNTFNNTEKKINSNVTISGTLYDWYDKDTLVYYGVSNDGINGLFTYDLKEHKEELLYKINEGFLAYLKGTENDVLFLQITLENKRTIMVIDKNTKNVNKLSSTMDEIKDIVKSNDKYYAIGKCKDNVESLYELKPDYVKRVVYDFPSIIEVEKGLALDENGDVLFIGAQKRGSVGQQIYKYSSDGTISRIEDTGTDYTFVEYIK